MHIENHPNAACPCCSIGAPKGKAPLFKAMSDLNTHMYGCTHIYIYVRTYIYVRDARVQFIHTPTSICMYIITTLAMGHLLL